MIKTMITYTVAIFLGVGLAAIGGYVTLSVLVDPIITARGVMDGE